MNFDPINTTATSTTNINNNNNNNDNTNNTAFGGDEKFIENLTNFLTIDNVKQICESYNKPIIYNNINPRTRRVRMGIPKTRPRKILRKDTLKNYKSIILRFCRYKLDNFGKDSPVTREVVEKFAAEQLVDGRKRKNTMDTITNVLNKYIFYPILGEELPKPIVSRSLTGNYFSNKPKFLHIEIAMAVLKMYKTCKNRDHVHKIILIYYTGLRSSEASSLTFNDIIDGYSKTNVIIPVRFGKGRKIRNVVIFRGGPMVYYREYFIPYIISKLEQLLLSMKENERIEDLLNRQIFSNSRYPACRKAFKKRLDWAVIKLKEWGVTSMNYNDYDEEEDEEDENANDEEDEDGIEEGNAESLKGSGLHSLRADWATRTLRLLNSFYKDHIVATNRTEVMLGHMINSRVINKHYINLGDGFDENNLDKFKEVLDKEYRKSNRMEYRDDGYFNFDKLRIRKDKVSLLFKRRGRIIKDLFKKHRSDEEIRRNYELYKLFKVTDTNHLFPSKIGVRDENNTTIIFNELNNNNDNYNNNDEYLPLIPDTTNNDNNNNTNIIVEDDNDNRNVDLVGNLVFI